MGNNRNIFASLTTLAFCLSATAKTIPTNNKIDAEQLSVSAVNDLYGDRIAPSSSLKISSSNLDSLDTHKRRVTRDTLLSHYRQKQLYKNLNRNLFESYFLTPATQRVTNDAKAIAPGFKKLVTNPYKDYKKPLAEVEPRAIYKKHPGFHVTDSVNHLKYLVDRNLGNQGRTNDNNNYVEEVRTVPREVTRMRRGDFFHNKSSSPVNSDTLAVLEQLRADNSLRI